MNKKAFLYIVISGILWGTSGIFFNLLEPFGYSPLHMTAMRGVVSAIAMSIYVALHNRKLFRVKPKEFILFVLSGVSIFGTASCYYAAIQASTVSTAVILMYTAPIFVMAYSVAFLGEKMNLAKGISVVLMIVGCALVSGIVNGMSFNLWGVVLGLSSGILYSVYNILTRIEMMNKSDSMSASVYNFIFMGTVATVTCNPAKLVSITVSNPMATLPLIIGIGICTCVLPYFLYTSALKKIPAGTASALGIIEPMAATIFSVAIFGEKLSIASITGIVLILIAVFLLSQDKE